jgi:hypothetical protein
LSVPKPLFANGRTGLAFGFQYQGPADQAVAHQPSTTAILKTDHWNGTQVGEDQGQDMGTNKMDEDPHGDNPGMIHRFPLCILTFFARTGDRHAGYQR